jgi:hypothetical protein
VLKSLIGARPTLGEKGRQGLTRNTVSAASLAFIAVVLAGGFLAELPLLQAQVPSKYTAGVTHRHAKPMITGVDGAQTGTASFLGNFTIITTPTGALSLFRKPDCSLYLASGNYTIDPLLIRKSSSPRIMSGSCMMRLN